MKEVLPQSLIILKNSIIEGRVPTSDNLEVGELALGLYKGQESIWSKNSSGEVVNLRSPRHDLMWGDLFKKYNTKDEFDFDLGLGIIKDTAVVFIEETKQLWTGGVFYGTEITWEDIEGYILSQVIVFPEDITEILENYNPDENYSDSLNKVFRGKLNFIRLLRNIKKKPYILSLILPGGTLPLISKSSEDVSNKLYILTLEYYYNGYYNKAEIKLENDLFSITKNSINLIYVGETVADLKERVSILENSGVQVEGIKWTDVIE